MWPTFPLVSQALQLAHLVGERHGRVDAVELEQVDALKAQVAEAELGLLPQVLRAADRRRQVRALTCEPDLGGDDQAIGVRVQRLLDDLLGHEGAVGVGGVDEVHAKLDGTAQHAHRLGRVLRVTPDARACQLHRPVAETVDREIPADRGDQLRACRSDRPPSASEPAPGPQYG
jgi:hypothetical protein